MCACKHVSTYVAMYVCMYVCVYVCMYCVYIRISACTHVRM